MKYILAIQFVLLVIIVNAQDKIYLKKSGVEINCTIIEINDSIVIYKPVFFNEGESNKSKKTSEISEIIFEKSESKEKVLKTTRSTEIKISDNISEKKEFVKKYDLTQEYTKTYKAYISGNVMLGIGNTILKNDTSGVSQIYANNKLDYYIETIHGFNFNNTKFVGFGVGFLTYTSIEEMFFMPMFVNYKQVVYDKEIQCMAEASFGASPGIIPNTYTGIDWGGIFFSTGLTTEIVLSNKKKANLNFGYRMQQIRDTYFIPGEIIKPKNNRATSNFIYLGIGFSFE